MNKALITFGFLFLSFQILLGIELIYSAVAIIADIPNCKILFTITFVLYAASAVAFLILKKTLGV